jgi:hypothetical protein
MKEASKSDTSLWAFWGLVALDVRHAFHLIHDVNDDAFITFRFSQLLAEGKGADFNPAERVQGCAHFRMMLIAAASIVGAERLFLPDHPNGHYLLAVFKKQDV